MTMFERCVNIHDDFGSCGWEEACLNQVTFHLHWDLCSDRCPAAVSPAGGTAV